MYHSSVTRMSHVALTKATMTGIAQEPEPPLSQSRGELLNDMGGNGTSVNFEIWQKKNKTDKIAGLTFNSHCNI